MEYLNQYTAVKDIDNIKKIIDDYLEGLYESKIFDINLSFDPDFCALELEIFDAFSIACAMRDYNMMEYYCDSIMRMYFFATCKTNDTKNEDYKTQSNFIEPFHNIRNYGNIFKFACRNNHFDIIDYLEKLPLKFNSKHRTVKLHPFNKKTINEGFIEACYAENIKMVKYLFKKYDIDITDKYILDNFNSYRRMSRYIASYIIVQYTKSHPEFNVITKNPVPNYIGSKERWHYYISMPIHYIFRNGYYPSDCKSYKKLIV